MKVYTGAGDDGTTGLFYGGRTRKDAVGPEAYGAVDEAVAALGLARAEIPDGTDHHQLVLRLQRELFVVGAELATAPENRHKLTDGTSRVSEAMCADLKSVIEEYESVLPELTEFVIPGADRLSAAFDLARTIIRRAERRAVEWALTLVIDDSFVLAYLNRLGDLVFLLARDVEGTARITLHGD